MWLHLRTRFAPKRAHLLFLARNESPSGESWFNICFVRPTSLTSSAVDGRGSRRWRRSSPMKPQNCLPNRTPDDCPRSTEWCDGGTDAREVNSYSRFCVMPNHTNTPYLQGEPLEQICRIGFAARCEEFIAFCGHQQCSLWSTCGA